LPGIYPAGFVKSPSAALRCSFVVAARPLVRLTPQFLRALHVGASSARPIMGVRPDAPTDKTIVPLAFSKLSTLIPLKKGFSFPG